MKGGGAMPKAGPRPQVKALREIKFLKCSGGGNIPIDAMLGIWWQAGQNTATFVSRPEAKET